MDLRKRFGQAEIHPDKKNRILGRRAGQQIDRPGSSTPLPESPQDSSLRDRSPGAASLPKGNPDMSLGRKS